MSIQLLVIVSDIHQGSIYSVMPDEFELNTGQIVRPANPLQNWLGEKWKEVWRQVDEYCGSDERAVVINGDVTEGNHHGTKDLWAVDEQDHADAAIDMLRPIVERSSVAMFTEGTECHTKKWEHYVAEKLGGVRDPNTGYAAWQRADITVHGMRCIMAHHISTTSREYLRASRLSIAHGNEIIAAVKAGEVPPMVYGAAHCHIFDVYCNDRQTTFTTPSWQGLTRYGRKVVPSARLEVGAVVLDWRGRDHGDKPRVADFIKRTAPTKGIAV